eukprot:5204557-Prymnesium_polylepis.1
MEEGPMAMVVMEVAAREWEEVAPEVVSQEVVVRVEEATAAVVMAMASWAMAVAAKAPAAEVMEAVVVVMEAAVEVKEREAMKAEAKGVDVTEE